MRLISRSGTLDQSQLRLPFDLSASLTFVMLAALILNPLFGARAALIFLAFGLVLLAIQPVQTLKALLRFSFLLILPAYCLLTALWSEYPDLTIRYSIQLALTIAVAIVIAMRVSPATLLRGLFACYSIGIVGSLLFGRVRDDTGAWVGLFGSKNAFAAVASGLALTSLALMLDRTAPSALRLAALGGLLASAPLLIFAQSVGSLTMIVPAMAVGIAIIASGWMSRGQKVAVTVILLPLGAVAAILLAAYGDALLASYLDMSGKDATLTGRTDLWDVGYQLIEDNPWLGLGYQAFWVKGNEVAESLWAMFGIEARSGFNFHNTYINNAVEIGLLGVGLQVAMLYGALLGVLGWALRAPCPENAFLASFLTLVIANSMLEAIVYYQFSIASIVAVCAFVYASRYREWRRANAARDTAASEPLMKVAA